jgi:hypothetical protein
MIRVEWNKHFPGDWFDLLVDKYGTIPTAKKDDRISEPPAK